MYENDAWWQAHKKVLRRYLREWESLYHSNDEAHEEIIRLWQALK